MFVLGAGGWVALWGADQNKPVPSQIAAHECVLTRLSPPPVVITQTVAALLDSTEPGSFDLEATNHDQRTPLECAAALGHWAVVRRFA